MSDQAPRQATTTLIEVLIGAALSAVIGIFLTEIGVPLWATGLAIIGLAGFAYWRLWPGEKVRVPKAVGILVILLASPIVARQGYSAISNYACSRSVGAGIDNRALRADYRQLHDREGRGRYGCPKGSPWTIAGAWIQEFEGGRLGTGVLIGAVGSGVVPLFQSARTDYGRLGTLATAIELAGVPTESRWIHGGRVIYFEGGSCGDGGFYRAPGTSRFYWVFGKIFEQFVEKGEVEGLYGYPIQPVDRPDGATRARQFFQKGVIKVPAEDIPARCQE